MSTSQAPKCHGDETANIMDLRLGKEIAPALLDAVGILINLNDPMGAKQAAEAVKCFHGLSADAHFLSPESTAKVVAALIVAEDTTFRSIEIETADKLNARLQYCLREFGYRLPVVEDGSYQPRSWAAMDIYVVAIDDNELWMAEVPEKYKPYLKNILTIRFFDKNAPDAMLRYWGNYRMYFQEHQAVFTDAAYEDDMDEMREEIYDWVMEKGRGVDSDGDIDAAGIDRLLAEHSGDRQRVYHFGNPAESWEDAKGDTVDEKYDSILEEVRESLSANPPIC